MALSVRLGLFAGLLLAVLLFGLPVVVDRSLNTLEVQALPPVSARASRLQSELFVVDLHSDLLLWSRDHNNRSL